MDKEYIINNSTKNEFYNFLINDKEGTILELLDDEGINILNKSRNKEERINYMLVYSSYINDLLKKDKFLEMFIESDISNYYANLRNLEFSTYETIMKKGFELNIDIYKLSLLLTYFNDEYQVNFFKNPNVPIEFTYEMLKRTYNPLIINTIIQNYDIDLSNDNIDISGLFDKAKTSVLQASKSRNLYDKIIDEINIPEYMITKELAQKIFEKYDIFHVRKIIDDASYCTSSTLLNNYIKNKEDYIINSCNNSSFVESINKIYMEYLKYKKLYSEYVKEDNDEVYRQCIKQKRILILELEKELGKNFDLNIIDDDNLIMPKLIELNNKSLSNYIVDYHFEENYYNIVLDINELLHFYYDGNILLPEDHVEIYNQILDIDKLSIDEKKELHSRLKNINVIETFYDDMSAARYIVNEAIKEYSLSSETIKQYKDDKLSNEYGVDVYSLDGDYFFGIVKTGRHMSDEMPTGHSYSLIGSAGLAVFGDVEKSDTFLYDSSSLSPEQIVHVYPFDSFTLYKPFEVCPKATRRVNSLVMPDELVNVTPSYNELLILEQGNKESYMDNKITKLKEIALYCVDEIRNQDIETAKNRGVGILLVNSKNYTPNENKSLYNFRTSIDEFNYNYFNGCTEKEKFDKNR